MERLTARSPKNNMPYLVNVKDNEQEVEGSYNTLKCIQNSWEKLAQYEETGFSPEEVAELITVKNELLEVLEELLENYRLNKGNGLGMGPIMKAKKAIAKATGERN